MTSADTSNATSSSANDRAALGWLIGKGACNHRSLLRYLTEDTTPGDIRRALAWAILRERPLAESSMIIPALLTLSNRDYPSDGLTTTAEVLADESLNPEAQRAIAERILTASEQDENVLQDDRLAAAMAIRRLDAKPRPEASP